MREYRSAMAAFAAARNLDIWYSQLTVDKMAAMAPKNSDTKRVEKAAAKARSRGVLKATAKLTEPGEGALRIADHPPLLVPLRTLPEDVSDQLHHYAKQSWDLYLGSLRDDCRVLVERYRMLDVALKVVGVGSVGTRCMLVLFEGRDDDDPFLLQVKQAEASVLEAHLGPGSYDTPGGRVVTGRRLIQASGDIFLGWSASDAGHHYYWRQFHDMKGSADVATQGPRRLELYAEMCGWTLAHAHARSGDPIAISGYLGTGDSFDKAATQFRGGLRRPERRRLRRVPRRHRQRPHRRRLRLTRAERRLKSPAEMALPSDRTPTSWALISCDRGMGGRRHPPAPRIRPSARAIAQDHPGDSARRGGQGPCRGGRVTRGTASSLPRGARSVGSLLGVVVTIAESDPVLAPAVHVREPAGPGRPDPFSVDDTTELRWFFAGPLPPGVREWFAALSGVAEERCDTYLLDGRCDVGVKRRFGKKLELKVRQSLDEPIELGDGLAGRTEAWRRWSPADGAVGDVPHWRWIDVHKSIVKRRFSVEGTEIAFSPQMTGAGCDVEIVDVTVAAVRGWSFAFAAFGPLATRTQALLASWQTLATATPRPDQFRPATGRAMGYPEWLALTVSSDVAVAP